MSKAVPEVKRYNMTTDKYDYPVPYETEHGQWVKYSSCKALQAECERWKNSASGAHQQLTENRIETDKLAVDWSNAMAEREKLWNLLVEIERGCSRRDIPSEQTISSWADAIDAALQEQTQ